MNEDRQRYAIHAAVFAALSNPTRHELMHLLCKEARTPSELADALDVSRPNVSQHLAVLHREGLVKRSRRDGHVLWEVVDPRLSQACELLDEILAPQLATKARALEKSASPAPHHTSARDASAGPSASVEPPAEPVDRPLVSNIGRKR